MKKLKMVIGWVEYSMRDYYYIASEILFNVDKEDYMNEYKGFKKKRIRR